MKKAAAIFVVLTLLLCVFAGCNNPSGNEKSTEQVTSGTTEASTSEISSSSDTTGSSDSDISPLIWHVTDDGGHEMYLMGTIHIADERAAEAIEKVKPWFDKCDSLAVEFDLVAYQNDLAAIMQDVMGFLLMDGTEISDHLDKKLYDKAVELLKSSGEYNASLDSYNVSFWYQLVEQAAISVYCSLDGKGIDERLINLAYEENKEILELESAAEQYELLNSFDDDVMIAEMQAILEDPQSFGQINTELYECWLSGDEEKLAQYALSDIDEEELKELSDELKAKIEEFSYLMLDARNEGMFAKAKEYISSGKTVFMTAGSAHMIGETGIVKALKEAGYTVEIIEL